ncbi:uncharacterized protein LOC108101457 [Drosophila ficusphila]|uniref:uncharacterized protein LOC108101457 n=1 Tax=Drosophila ficusphila TaxID=30025 RepID=UPI0007E7355D|nr:uncharacterized protein LOC108101457 [Drosophila ficusphila]
MPIFARNLPSIRHLAKRSLMDGRRSLTTVSGLEGGRKGGVTTSSAWKKDWPKREENFAAAQLLRQRQQNRQWSNHIPHLDSAMFRPVVLPDDAIPRRNNVVAAQNAAKRRNVLARQASQENRNAMQEQQDREEERLSRELQAQEEEYDDESDLEVRSVRETVFGPPEDNDEEDRKRAQADNELLRRVTVTSQQNQDRSNRPSISRKVISPYMSYRSHRTRWAEFRHSMIYGRSSY